MDATTAKQIESLTRKAITAHGKYRDAKAANLKPIQSPREVKTNAVYQDLRTKLVAACEAAGVATPKTWNVYN